MAPADGEGAFEALLILIELINEKQKYDRLVQAVKDFCIEFDDVLPVRAGGPYGIEYAGPPSPPSGGFDKFALDLVQIVQTAYVE